MLVMEILTGVIILAGALAVYAQLNNRPILANIAIGVVQLALGIDFLTTGRYGLLPYFLLAVGVFALGVAAFKRLRSSHP